MRAETEVGTVPEAELEDVGPFDIEHAAELDVFGGQVGDLRAGAERDVPHELLHRVGGELGLLAQ